MVSGDEYGMLIDLHVVKGCKQVCLVCINIRPQ